MKIQRGSAFKVDLFEFMMSVSSVERFKLRLVQDLNILSF